MVCAYLSNLITVIASLLGGSQPLTGRIYLHGKNFTGEMTHFFKILSFKAEIMKKVHNETEYLMNWEDLSIY